MQFRPCIDIHDGKVKQIVGSSLNDSGARENYVSEYDSVYYANYYKDKGIKGGHVILLNKEGTDEYERTRQQAVAALTAYPGGLQVGGGINADNAKYYIDNGASHVIVTSYVFRNGMVDYERLAKLSEAVGREHIVLDLSCRRKNDGLYYIVTDRWQKYTDVVINTDTLLGLEKYADEFLIHAVDVEGKSSGPDRELVGILAKYTGIPVTYAGGVHSYDDLQIIKQYGNGMNVTVGSALDIFGGPLHFDTILDICKK